MNAGGTRQARTATAAAGRDDAADGGLVGFSKDGAQRSSLGLCEGVRYRDRKRDRRARNSNEAPDDFVPLKAAAAHAPHVEYEWLRRRCESGEIESKQNGKNARIKASISSLLRVVRENWG